MKSFVLAVIIAACAFQSVAQAQEDPIKSTVRNRALRKAKAARAKQARDIQRYKERLADERDAVLMQRQVRANEQHAAQMQHAINGHNANLMQAQSNAIQAQRNQVLADGNRAVLGAAGVVICGRCGQFGHYACGPLQKSQAVLEHEALVGRLIP